MGLGRPTWTWKTETGLDGGRYYVEGLFIYNSLKNWKACLASDVLCLLPGSAYRNICLITHCAVSMPKN